MTWKLKEVKLHLSHKVSLIEKPRKKWIHRWSGIYKVTTPASTGVHNDNGMQGEDIERLRRSSRESWKYSIVGVHK